MNYYELLGVAPDTTSGEIIRAYEAKMVQVQRGVYTNAPEDVVAAEHRASAAFETAMKTLSDPALRAKYDAELRLAGELATSTARHRESWRRRHAEHVWAMEREMGKPLTPVFGLEPPTGDEQPNNGTEPRTLADPVMVPDEEWTTPLYDPLADLERIANWFAPQPPQSRNVTVPDVCGLHSGDAFYKIAVANLQFRCEHLTSDPVGEGVVVAQDPPAGTSVRRHSVITLQVVHQDADELNAPAG